MFGYLRTRPQTRTSDFAGTKEDSTSSALENSTESNTPQATGYLSWESISYFFGGWTINDAPVAPPLGKKLEETIVDSEIIQHQKKETGNMEKTMEYTVTSYDTLPKIALTFDVTPSELTRLNKLSIRTLYPGQVLRVPCPKPTDKCSDCSEAIIQEVSPPKTMTMNHHHHLHHLPVAKRVSFDDIDEDVLETFIKIKSKYITDGQGVVRGFLLVTPHAVIFHPDVSEILVKDRGAEYYQVNFPMESVCAAGMFDDIASMADHSTLQPGHFFLDKPLMKWLGDSGTTLCKEEVKTDSSSSTLRPSLSASMSREDIPESVTSPETKMVRDLLNDMLEQVDDKIVEVRSEDSSVQGPVLQSRLRDVVVSSSSHSGLTSDGNHHPLSEEIEQLSHATGTLDAHQMNSTPKLKPYEEAVNVHQVTAKGIDRDSEGRGYSEGISSDSGIDEHLSRETVHGDSSIADHHDPKLWLENFNTKQGQAFDSKEVIPKLSTCHVDMPKYLCVKIKKACWPGLRPRLCCHAHEAIQRANDERREFWFSIPSERLLEVYGFFLELCPAIHDGESDGEEPLDVETDLVGSCSSDYSVITMSEFDEEGLKLVDDFYSQSPEKIPLRRKRLHSREKQKKQKAEKKEAQRKPSSSWSVCSIEESLPEMIGKSEILTEAHIVQLARYLPSRTIGHSWRLIYSTYIHGISLKTLYRTMADYDTPALLVVMDESREVFGAFASSPFAVSEHFYGTGECFLYSFHPELKVFRWSGENHFFIKGDIDSLAFGGGDGNFGLWLDEDLYHGSSHRCKTYNNEPLTITEDFLCCGIETWCFE